MNLIQPAIHLSGDKTRAIILKAKALALYSFLGQSLVNSGLPFINRRVVFSDGSTIEVRIKKESNYNNYSGTISLYSVPLVEELIPEVAKGIFVAYGDIPDKIVYTRLDNPISFETKTNFRTGKNYWINADESKVISWITSQVFIEGNYSIITDYNIKCCSVIGSNIFTIDHTSNLLRISKFLIEDFGSSPFTLTGLFSRAFFTVPTGEELYDIFFLTDSLTVYLLTRTSSGAKHTIYKFVFIPGYSSNTQEIILQNFPKKDVTNTTGSWSGTTGSWSASGSSSNSTSSGDDYIHSMINHKDEIDIITLSNYSFSGSGTLSQGVSSGVGTLSATSSSTRSFEYSFKTLVNDVLTDTTIPNISWSESGSSSSNGSNGGVGLYHLDYDFISSLVETDIIFYRSAKNIVIYHENTYDISADLEEFLLGSGPFGTATQDSSSIFYKYNIDGVGILYDNGGSSTSGFYTTATPILTPNPSSPPLELGDSTSETIYNSIMDKNYSYDGVNILFSYGVSTPGDFGMIVSDNFINLDILGPIPFSNISVTTFTI